MRAAAKARLLAGCEEEFLAAVFARPQVLAQIEWGERQEPGFAYLARCAYQWGLRVRDEGIDATTSVFEVNDEDP